MNKDYIKNLANEINIEVNDAEIENIYDYLFNDENGVIKYLISSKLKDLEYDRENKIENKNDMELDN